MVPVFIVSMVRALWFKFSYYIQLSYLFLLLFYVSIFVQMKFPLNYGTDKLPIT